ncbi:hypothetical protein ACWEOI_09515 [Nocardia sp. NPDC004340]|uniref:hypothetical protein n=1 Tax=Nocardia sp. CA-136227 TaxID=3239979 RepID=UPI003D988215
MVIVLIPAVTAACTEKKETPVAEHPPLCSEPWPDFVHWNYDALAQQQIQPNLKQQYPNLFDGENLKPWDVINNGTESQANVNRASVTELLNKADGGADIGKQLQNDYLDKRTRICGSDH